MVIWNNELYHSWGLSAKMKRLEHLYNKWYYQHNKDKWKDNDNDSKTTKAVKNAQKNINKASSYERRNVERMSSKYADIIKTKSDGPSKSSGSSKYSGSASISSEKSKGKKSAGKKKSTGKKKSAKKKTPTTKPKLEKERINDSYNYVYENGKLVKINKKRTGGYKPVSKPSKKKKYKKKKYKSIKTNKKSSINVKHIGRGMKVLNNVLKNRRK